MQFTSSEPPDERVNTMHVVPFLLAAVLVLRGANAMTASPSTSPTVRTPSASPTFGPTERWQMRTWSSAPFLEWVPVFIVLACMVGAGSIAIVAMCVIARAYVHGFGGNNWRVRAHQAQVERVRRQSITEISHGNVSSTDIAAKRAVEQVAREEKARELVRSRSFGGGHTGGAKTEHWRWPHSIGGGHAEVGVLAVNVAVV